MRHDYLFVKITIIITVRRGSRLISTVRVLMMALMMKLLTGHDNDAIRSERGADHFDGRATSRETTVRAGRTQQVTRVIGAMRTDDCVLRRVFFLNDYDVLRGFFLSTPFECSRRPATILVLQHDTAVTASTRGRDTLRYDWTTRLCY